MVTNEPDAGNDALKELRERLKAQAEKPGTTLPCPFCGEADNLEFTDEVLGQIQVVCSECGAFGPGGDSHDAANALWNRAIRW